METFPKYCKGAGEQSFDEQKAAATDLAELALIFHEVLDCVNVFSLRALDWEVEVNAQSMTCDATGTGRAILYAPKSYQ